MIKVTQELQAQAITDLVNPDYGTIEDFVSPIIKIEPLGLELKKSATLKLETDKNRLGNNSPLTVSWIISDDKVNWTDIGYIDGNMDTNEYKEYTPTTIKKFAYLSKQIPSFVQPNDIQR